MEKSVITKETAKGTLLYSIAEKLVRRLDTVRRFLGDPSSRKKRSNCGTSKSLTTTNLRNVSRLLCEKPGQISKAIFTAAELCRAKNHQKSNPQNHGFCANSPENASFDSSSQEFDAPMGSELHDIGPELCPAHWKDQGHSWRTWRLGKCLCLFWRWASSTFTMKRSGWRRHVAVWYN